MSELFERRRYRADNYLYAVGEGGDVALVDPGDAALALRLCRELGVRPRALVHTHGHADHSGGSEELRAATGAPVYGHAADAAWFRPDEDLAGREELRLGELRIRVRPAPGHTPGSVLLEWRGRLLTGDTLFWGGCGNCRHGGDARALAGTVLGTVAALDGALGVHPGHDYAALNLPFAADLEPGNPAVPARLRQVEAARAAGLEPEAPSLAQEREVNPFLRLERLREALERRGVAWRSAEEAFLALRALRDRW